MAKQAFSIANQQPGNAPNGAYANYQGAAPSGPGAASTGSQTAFSGTQNNGEVNQGGYAYGLQTNFSGNAPKSGLDILKTNGANWGSYGGNGANSSDPDVRRAQALQNELDAAVRGNSQGTNQGAVYSQIQALRSRIGLKNSLGSAIDSSGQEMGDVINNQKSEADQALSSGLKNTRENYNRRGLLYSGLREGGEQGIKAGVGANLASNIAGTKRDYQNTNEARKQAYASLGLATQAQNLELANQAFNTTTKNNIAREQAYQQLGQGVGGVVGSVAAYSQRQQPQQPQQPTYLRRHASGEF